ncbi:L-sorbose 1-dehydrogenase-like [Mercenaria mercenaria]|uniref:L-sorbose 1-dehydrogenase-like n=1 Tax=Mercenaria mercenaria TaxID=6596 RepID=UPI00234EB668|nr:L-sorbose 1-dehydrogenase-like [Mercenaria mercenaria]
MQIGHRLSLLCAYHIRLTNKTEGIMGYTATALSTLAIAIIYFRVFLDNITFSDHRRIVSDVIDDEYDYVIVGGGTAGSVVAARLSEDKDNKVLLLEAGGFYDENWKLHSLTLWPELLRTQYDWEYYTEPQKHSCFGMKETRSYWPRGRVLGGSGMINLAQYTRGSRYDYDEWAANGCKGWSYKDVLPYFLKAEDIQIEEFKSSKYHNVGGPMAVSGGEVTQLAEIYLKAGKELGYNITDYNGEEQEGFNKVQVNARKGVRESSAVAYLGRAGKKINLDIAVNTFVTKVDFKKTAATGVYYIRNNRKHFVRARKEVILSAGAINTPKILLLSGIGPRHHLDEMSIPVVADLPVGNNLQDHGAIFLFTRINKPISITPSVRNSLWTTLQHKIFGSGPLSIAGTDGSAFVHIDDKNRSKTYPDFQMSFISLLFSFDYLNFKDEIKKEYEAGNENADGFTLALINTHPKSRGTLRLRSKDPFDHPVLDPHYFQEQQDVDDFVSAIRIWEKYIETPTMKALGAEISHMKKSFCLQHEFRSDAYWECMLRHLALPGYHLSCTCKTGSHDDSTAVLDPTLRVKGMKGLRVVDASAFPKITVGNTNTPTVMLAEKATDMIRGIDSVKHLRKNLLDGV